MRRLTYGRGQQQAMADLYQAFQLGEREWTGRAALTLAEQIYAVLDAQTKPIYDPQSGQPIGRSFDPEGGTVELTLYQADGLRRAVQAIAGPQRFCDARRAMAVLYLAAQLDNGIPGTDGEAAP
jgi:hypothetical protein